MASLRILLRKDFKIELRTKRQLGAEILVIIILCLFILVNPFRDTQSYEPTEADLKNFRIFGPEYLLNLDSLKELIATPITSLAYTPNQGFSNVIMQAVAEKLELEPMAFESENEMLQIFDPETTLAGVVFSNYEGGTMPRNLTIKIRFPGTFRTIHAKEGRSNTWLTRCTGVITDSPTNTEGYLQSDIYFREGFLQLQNQIFTEWLNALEDEIGRQPTYFLPVARVHTFRLATQKSMCEQPENLHLSVFLYSFLFFLPFLNLVWNYGRERDQNILVHNWRLGLSRIKYWFSHFLISLAHLFILDLIILILLGPLYGDSSLPGSIRNASVSEVLLLLILVSVALIITAILTIAVCPFSRIAVLLAIVFWLAFYSVFAIFLESTKSPVNEWLFLSVMVFFNNGLSYGMLYMKNLTNPDDSETWALMLAILLNILFTLLLVVVLDSIFPGRYRRGCLHRKKKPNSVIQSDPHRLYMRDYVDYGARNNAAYVHVSNVSTYYKRDRVTVPFLNNINLVIYQGEITVIFGHNSSGKTTLLSLIADWIKPDDGYIRIIDKQSSKKTRRFVDICTPENQLFDYLTAYEHLVFYASIKKSSPGNVHANNLEIDKWLAYMAPVFQTADGVRKVYVKDMTFEQTRLVALACAMIKNTPIILLDEPTLHMRASEQIVYWRILQKEKAERAIIIATFSMDEALAIGDRFAVLVLGKLVGFGNPSFLMSQTNPTFDLSIIKDEEANVESITAIVRNHLENIVVASESPDRVVYKIPADSTAVFQRMLIELKSNQENLGIKEITLYSSSMQDAYTQMGGKAKERQMLPTQTSPNMNFLGGSKLARQQWRTAFYKKTLHLSPFIVPVLIVVLSILLLILMALMMGTLKKAPTGEEAKGATNLDVYFGLPPGSTSRALTDPMDMENCQFVSIKDIRVTSLQSERKYEFLPNSFECINEYEFEDYMKEARGTIPKWGAMSEGQFGRFDLYINQHMFHSAPVVLNLVHNRILKNLYENEDDIVTTIINDPLPLPASLSSVIPYRQMQRMFLPIAIGVLIPIAVACAVYPLVDERIYNILGLSLMAGMRLDVYWFVTFLWDWMILVIGVIIYLLGINLIVITGVSFLDNIAFLGFFMLYFVPALLSVYYISLFRHHSSISAFLICCLMFIVTGVFIYILYWELLIINKEWYPYVLSISPTYSLLDAISNIYIVARHKTFCKKACDEMAQCTIDKIGRYISACGGQEMSYFHWNDGGVNRPLIYLVLMSVVLICILFWTEVYDRETRFYVRPEVKQMSSAIHENEDPEVRAVKERIANYDLQMISKHRIVVDQLERQTPKRMSTDLKTISFEVDKRTCLVIYGTRHSGKTHLTRQLVGWDGFSFGDVYIRRTSLKYNLYEVYKNLGHCPQICGLYFDLTIRQLYRIFYCYRGVPLEEVPNLITDLLNLLALARFIDTKIGKLSTIKQRKVSIGLAFISMNRAIIIDEPTRGMPAWTCREIWTAINYYRNAGAAIIITTSDSAECSELSDRVLLFDKGEMLGYGDLNSLKQKFSTGFYLDVKVEVRGITIEETERNLNEVIDNIKRFLTMMHNHPELIRRNDHYLRFYVPVENINFNLLYGALERARTDLRILEYRIEPGSIMDVMLNSRARRDGFRNAIHQDRRIDS